MTISKQTLDAASGLMDAGFQLMKVDGINGHDEIWIANHSRTLEAAELLAKWDIPAISFPKQGCIEIAPR